jgi:hypothetical protein
MNNLHFQDPTRHTPARYDSSGKDEAPGIAKFLQRASILWFSRMIIDIRIFHSHDS